MPATAHPPTAPRLGDAAAASLITAFFAAAWLEEARSTVRQRLG